nr:hypothetical protein [uncultured Undibacterium sp.]
MTKRVELIPEVLSTERDHQITSNEIYAIVNAGAETGILQTREHDMIGNEFELESRAVPSAMSQRASIVYALFSTTKS